MKKERSAMRAWGKKTVRAAAAGLAVVMLAALATGCAVKTEAPVSAPELTPEAATATPEPAPVTPEAAITTPEPAPDTDGGEKGETEADAAQTGVLVITYYTNIIKNDCSIHVGDPSVTFAARLLNDGVTEEDAESASFDVMTSSTQVDASWVSSEPSIMTVEENEDGTCVVSVLGGVKDGATLTAEYGGALRSITIYCVP